MDPSVASCFLAAAALFGAGAPIVRRQQRSRAWKREQLRYLESLLVEARSATFPVPRRRVTV